MPDLEVMQGIDRQWGTLIEAVCAASFVPPAFLAALICNETGGDPKAKRFEPVIFLRLNDVIANRKSSFTTPGIDHPLTRSEILAFVSPADLATSTTVRVVPKYTFADSMLRLESLATSYGLTQIMGWHALEFRAAWHLSDPRENLNAAAAILAYFANRYQLELRGFTPPLFRCWNTGQPDGATFDPHYVENGMQRMALWEQIQAQKGVAV